MTLSWSITFFYDRFAAHRIILKIIIFFNVQHSSGPKVPIGFCKISNKLLEILTLKLYASLWFCGLFDLAPKILQNCKQWAPLQKLQVMALLLVLVLC